MEMTQDWITWLIANGVDIPEGMGKIAAAAAADAWNDAWDAAAADAAAAAIAAAQDAT